MPLTYRYFSTRTPSFCFAAGGIISLLDQIAISSALCAGEGISAISLKRPTADFISSMAFFVASAAYRGFKIRNLEASLLLFAAILVMIGRVPLGDFISPYFPKVANWILTVPSMTARRGIFVGIGLGTIATSLRVILGVERTYLGRS